MIRKEALELLVLGAVLGGRRDLLGELTDIVRTPKGRSLVAAMTSAAEGNADSLYGWFRDELKVDLDRGPERLIDAIVSELAETARLDREANAGFASWKEAAKRLAQRVK